MNKLLIFLISAFTIIAMFLVNDFTDRFSDRVFLTSLLIQVFSIWNIFNNMKSPFSLKKTFYIFTFFFFGVAPLLQMYKRVSLFDARILTEAEYFYMNLLIIIILALYQASYNFFYKRRLSVKRIDFIKKLKIDKRLNLQQTTLLILFSFLSFYMVFIANNRNIYSMFFRGGDIKESMELSKAYHLILFRVFQPLSMMILLYYIVSKSKNVFVYILLGCLAFITCFPLAMPRFAAAAIYLPLLILTIPWLRKKNVFSLVFILGLLIVFPFLDNFRVYNSDIDISLDFNFDMFIHGHFDSYQNFALIVSENTITYGRQLLGVIFFWFPRTLWPNKPIGSGAYFAQKEGFEFDNVSCNYFAEGYINFGFLGIFLFVLILSYATSTIDKYYWKIIVNVKNNYFHVIYFVLIGVLVFILRGDLMSSFAFTVGFLISIWMVYVLANLKILK